jgi:hypothetical protein
MLFVLDDGAARFAIAGAMKLEWLEDGRFERGSTPWQMNYETPHTG